jgi:hypothetical protein
MVTRRCAMALVATMLALWWQIAATGAQPSCRFVLGFANLRDLVGADVVGTCLEDEHFNLENGNAEQRTSGGMLVWRKIDNFTAFTDGGTTWVNGPNGLQSRLNGERFSWESDPVTPARSAPPSTNASSPSAPPAGGSSPLIVTGPSQSTPTTASASSNSPAAPTPTSTVTPTPSSSSSSSSSGRSATPTPTPTSKPGTSSSASSSSSAGRTDPVGGQCPDSHQIKGATTSKGEKFYYEPGRTDYANVTPEICFTAGGDARDAGYVSSKR